MAGSLALYERDDEQERVKIPGPISDDIVIAVNVLSVLCLVFVVALVAVSVNVQFPSISLLLRTYFKIVVSTFWKKSEFFFLN